MPALNTTARLEARISTDLHAMLKRAADLVSPIGNCSFY